MIGLLARMVSLRSRRPNETLNIGKRKIGTYKIVISYIALLRSVTVFESSGPALGIEHQHTAFGLKPKQDAVRGGCGGQHASG